MANRHMRLSLDEVRRIEAFFREMEDRVDGDSSFRNELVVRATGHDVTLPPTHVELLQFYLETCRRIIHISGPLKDQIRLAKQEVGVVLDPTSVRASVQSLFAEIKKELDKK